MQKSICSHSHRSAAQLPAFKKLPKSSATIMQLQEGPQVVLAACPAICSRLLETDDAWLPRSWPTGTSGRLSSLEANLCSSVDHKLTALHGLAQGLGIAEVSSSNNELVGLASLQSKVSTATLHV